MLSTLPCIFMLSACDRQVVHVVRAPPPDASGAQPLPPGTTWIALVIIVCAHLQCSAQIKAWVSGSFLRQCCESVKNRVISLMRIHWPAGGHAIAVTPFDLGERRVPPRTARKNPSRQAGGIKLVVGDIDYDAFDLKPGMTLRCS